MRIFNNQGITTINASNGGIYELFILISYGLVIVVCVDVAVYA